jgi:flagellar hook-basal body complex protein FliE
MVIKGLDSSFGISQLFQPGANGVKADDQGKGAGNFMNELGNKIGMLDGGSGIDQLFPTAGAKGVQPTEVAKNAGNFMNELVNKVNDLQHQADREIQKLATGESKGLHEVMLAVEKSGVAFQFLNQVRNKAVDAYQEIMRMQV